MGRWTVVLLLVLFACLGVVGQEQGRFVMASGDNWAIYGQPLGISQVEWNNMTQARRDEIKNIARMSQQQNALGSAADFLPGQAPAPIPTDSYSDPGTVTYEDPGGGGGGGSYAAAAPTRVLSEAPEWLAYLNALGLEENQYRADIDRQKALYQSESDRQLQDLPVGFQQQRRGISGSMETRGMARSGEFLRKLAENRASQGRAEGAIKGQLAFQTGSLESQLAQKLIDINARKAQQELSLRGQGYV